MSSWNYRVCKNGDDFSIREVYYDDGGAVTGYTEPQRLEGWENEDDVRIALAMMLKDALSRDVLNIDDEGETDMMKGWNT